MRDESRRDLAARGIEDAQAPNQHQRAETRELHSRLLKGDQIVY